MVFKQKYRYNMSHAISGWYHLLYNRMQQTELPKCPPTVVKVIKVSAMIYGSYLLFRSASCRISYFIFNNSLNNWCEEKKGTNEHNDRIEAAKRIKECYDSDDRELDLSYLQITSLPSALKCLAGLKSLYLSGIKISDLSALQELKALEVLYLNGTRVSDLSALHGLKTLKDLFLNATRVDDISPLQELTNLRRLDLNETQVRDLWPLQGLTNLQDLDVKGTPVQGIWSLQRLTNLQHLNIRGTQVSDISPLQELTNLRYLDLRGTQVQDRSPLRGLTNLWVVRTIEYQPRRWDENENVMRRSNIFPANDVIDRLMQASLDESQYSFELCKIEMTIFLLFSDKIKPSEVSNARLILESNKIKSYSYINYPIADILRNAWFKIKTHPILNDKEKEIAHESICINVARCVEPDEGGGIKIIVCGNGMGVRIANAIRAYVMEPEEAVKVVVGPAEFTEAARMNLINDLEKCQQEGGTVDDLEKRKKELIADIVDRFKKTVTFNPPINESELQLQCNALASALQDIEPNS